MTTAVTLCRPFSVGERSKNVVRKIIEGSVTRRSKSLRRARLASVRDQSGSIFFTCQLPFIFALSEYR